MEREGVMSGHLPIIALTANVTSESEQRCREAGMDYFLPKPLIMAGAYLLKLWSLTLPLY